MKPKRIKPDYECSIKSCRGIKEKGKDICKACEDRIDSYLAWPEGYKQ